MKVKVSGVGVMLCVNGDSWVLNTLLYTDGTIMIAKDESGLQKIGDVFGAVCLEKQDDGVWEKEKWID